MAEAESNAAAAPLDASADARAVAGSVPSRRVPAPAPGRAPAGAPVPAPERPARSAPQRALQKLGLLRDIDLALHLPMRYEDETRLTPVAALRDGDKAQVEGVVVHTEVQARSSRRQLLVCLHDAAGDELRLRFLYFHPSRQRALARGVRLRVRGEARGGWLGLEMVHPEVRRVEAGLPLATTLTPVYPSGAGLPQSYLRRAVAGGLKRADLGEVIPPMLLPAGLPSLCAALQGLHQPPADVPPAVVEDRGQPAWQRLLFDELVAQQLSQLQARRERAKQRAPRLELQPGGLQDRLLAALPFGLTAAQRRVGSEIAADLQRPLGSGASAARVSVPMHRLLQGDVGSGKTVVAALAAAIAMHAGWQCALMAPTEILAEQHFAKLVGWLAPLGVGMAWLSGSRKGRGRREMLARVESGEAALVVGTHAVIQRDVTFARLGLAIVDEQHRFGVAQRLALRQKILGADGPSSVRAESEQPAGSHQGRENEVVTRLQPHLLMMSATPIPRTLAMTLFADLDISTLDELPPGRTPVVTKLFADSRRDAVVGRIRDAVADGRQVYWVCPLVDESEHVDLQNATATHQQLCAALPGVPVGLLHGRMKPADKAAAMAGFVGGQTAVLVSTTVIEVGVDVPNASLMVIEHAERFGLAQLHQLRGRVGRGAAASVCVLLYGGPLSDTGRARLQAMAQTSDGFEIARRDLAIRGPGEFLGARQSGAPLLRFAGLDIDPLRLAEARAAAVAMLGGDPALTARQIDRWLGGRAEFINA